MNVKEIMRIARETTWTTKEMSQMDDISLLPYLNIVYHDVENNISQWVDAKFFIKSFTSDLIGWTNKYAFRNTQQPFKSIEKVYVKNTSDTDYIEITEWSWEYTIIDDYIVLSHTPSENIAWWLKVDVVINLPDLKVTSQESDVFLWYDELKSYHTILVEWLRVWIYRLKQQTNESQVAQKDFDTKMKKIVKAIAKRNNEIFEATVLDSDLI